eukprot:g2073.t1
MMSLNLAPEYHQIALQVVELARAGCEKSMSQLQVSVRGGESEMQAYLTLPCALGPPDTGGIVEAEATWSLAGWIFTWLMLHGVCLCRGRHDLLQLIKSVCSSIATLVIFMDMGMLRSTARGGDPGHWTKQAFESGVGLHSAAVASAVAEGLWPRRSCSSRLLCSADAFSHLSALIALLRKSSSLLQGLALCFLPTASTVVFDIAALALRYKLCLELGLALAGGIAEPVALVLTAMSCTWLLRLPTLLAVQSTEAAPSIDQELGEPGVTSEASGEDGIFCSQTTSCRLQFFAQRCCRAQSLPLLRLHRCPRAGSWITSAIQSTLMKRRTYNKAKTAMKAVPVLAAAVAEIPAVREELRQRLGEDLAPHVVAGEALRRFKSEAQRLGAQAAATARELERQARGLVEGVAEEVNETVVMAEHVAEDLLHHSPPPRRATRPWVYFAFVFGVLLCGVGYRRSRRRPRRPTGTRGARGTSTPPRSGSNSVLPLAPRESVMQRAPSFSSLTPVRVNKVEFQRVEVTAPEWDSPSECEKESSAEVRQEGGLNMGKGDVKTEYYQISSRQDASHKEVFGLPDKTCRLRDHTVPL